MSQGGFPPRPPFPPGYDPRFGPPGPMRVYPPRQGDMQELVDPADAHNFGRLPGVGYPQNPYPYNPGNRSDLGGRKPNRPTAHAPHGASTQTGDIVSCLSREILIKAGFTDTYITLQMDKLGSRAQIFGSRVQAVSEPAAPQGPFTENPLAQFPVLVGNTPIGGVLALARQTFGADGYGDTVYYDLPAGQTVRQCIACGSSRVSGLLVPKYYTPIGAGTAADPRTYTIGPGGDPLTTLRFNNPNVDDLELVFPTVSHAAVRLGGWNSDGSQSVDLVGRATRRFNGTVSVVVADAKGAKATIIPVAYRASHVLLTGGFENLGNGTTDAVEMNFFANGTQIGPFPQNTFEPIPLPSGTDFIRISNAAAVINTVDIAFEVIYFLSF